MPSSSAIHAAQPPSHARQWDVVQGAHSHAPHPHPPLHPLHLSHTPDASSGCSRKTMGSMSGASHWLRPYSSPSSVCPSTSTSICVKMRAGREHFQTAGQASGAPLLQLNLSQRMQQCSSVVQQCRTATQHHSATVMCAHLLAHPRLGPLLPQPLLQRHQLVAPRLTNLVLNLQCSERGKRGTFLCGGRAVSYTSTKTEPKTEPRLQTSSDRRVRTALSGKTRGDGSDAELQRSPAPRRAAPPD